jgi:hypothetical protein
MGELRRLLEIRDMDAENVFLEIRGVLSLHSELFLIQGAGIDLFVADLIHRNIKERII